MPIGQAPFSFLASNPLQNLSDNLNIVPDMIEQKSAAKAQDCKHWQDGGEVGRCAQPRHMGSRFGIQVR